MNKLIFLFFVIALVTQNSLAQSHTCSNFSITKVNKSASDPNKYLINLQYNGTNADFISYPHFPALFGSNGDTIATAQLEFYGQFGGTTQEYTILSAVNLTETPFKATFVYTTNGNKTCTLSSPLTDIPAPDESILVSSKPSTEQIHINLNKQAIGSNFILTNHLGQVVLSGKINSTNTTIDLANLSKGVYFLSVGENRKTIKVVKE